MSLKQLGLVKEIVESVGMNISYASDDLVFLDHNAFLLQFTEESDKLLLHCNCEADKDSIRDAIAILKGAALGNAMTFVDGSDYSLSQADDENINIEFITENQ